MARRSAAGRGIGAGRAGQTTSGRGTSARGGRHAKPGGSNQKPGSGNRGRHQASTKAEKTAAAKTKQAAKARMDKFPYKSLTEKQAAAARIKKNRGR